jgi:hypothetical protein
MNNEQIREHIINDIKELKQNIIVIEESLQKFRISFLHHKYKEEDELKESLISFLQDLPNFIIIEMHFMRDINSNCSSNYEICPKIEDALINTMIIAENQTKYYMEIRRLRLCYPDIQQIMELYPKIEDVLIHTMLIKEKKLKCYENLMELYPEKPEIKNLMELYPDKPDIENIMELYPEKPEIKNKQYSISLYVIFLIMIVFYIITVTTVILLINYNNNTTQLDHPIQCIMPTFKHTKIINKHNQLKDLMII